LKRKWDATTLAPAEAAKNTRLVMEGTINNPDRITFQVKYFFSCSLLIRMQ
jgi:hypothetical protein